MINKKIHAEMIARREKPEPEVQQLLRQSLRSVLTEGVVTFLPNHAWSEFGLTIGVDRTRLLEVASKLRDDPKLLFNMLIDVTCVDWLDSKPLRFEVVYQLLSLTHQHRLTVKSALPEESAEIASLRSLWPAANFLEREVWDMYGISFTGHGDLRRILMYDEFVGHPLRKDYPVRGKQPRVPLRIPELRNTSADMLRGDLVAMPRLRPVDESGQNASGTFVSGKSVSGKGVSGESGSEEGGSGKGEGASHG